MNEYLTEIGKRGERERKSIKKKKREGRGVQLVGWGEKELEVECIGIEEVCEGGEREQQGKEEN